MDKYAAVMTYQTQSVDASQFCDHISMSWIVLGSLMYFPLHKTRGSKKELEHIRYRHWELYEVGCYEI